MATADNVLLEFRLRRGGAITLMFVGEFNTFHNMAIPGEMNDDALKAKLRPIDDRIKAGTIFDAPTKELKDGLHAMCEQASACLFTAREINKAILINTILAERRSRMTNCLVIFLAIVGLVVGTGQLYYASRPSKTEEHVGQHQLDEDGDLDPDGGDQQTVEPVDATAPVVPKDLADPTPNE